MDVLDIFILGVEVCIALAGFSGVIATFQFSGDAKVRRAPVAALTEVVQISLAGALTSFVPLLVNTFGVTDSTLWAFSSAVGLPIMVSLMYVNHRDMRPAIQKQSVLLIYWLLQGISLLVVIANVLNFVNVIFHREPGPYLMVVALAVGLAGYMYSRLLLLPLWRRVREQENAVPADSNLA